VSLCAYNLKSGIRAGSYNLVKTLRDPERISALQGILEGQSVTRPPYFN